MAEPLLQARTEAGAYNAEGATVAVAHQTWLNGSAAAVLASAAALATGSRKPSHPGPSAVTASSASPLFRALCQPPPRLGECPERLADRGRLVHFGGPGGFAMRSGDDPVVGSHLRVGEEHLPRDGADRENREVAVVRGARGRPSAT